MIGFYKVVSSLPVTLEPDSLYAVRIGTGFDLYVTNSTGTVAHLINPSEQLNPRTQPNNTSTIVLYTSGGTSRVDQVNSATNYTVTIDSNAPVNSFDLILINAATEPTVNGISAGKIAGATFAASTDMHMVIRTLDGTNIQYFFLEI